MKEAKLLFLGTGASTGIPVIGCPCHVCHSHNPKNKRLRTAALIQVDGKNYLIDAGPDIRRQAIQYQINTLDGLILTHSHFDHVGGLEELRIFNFIHHRPIDCILSDESHEDIKKLFHYHFHNRCEAVSAKLNFMPLAHSSGTTELNGLKFSYFCYMQGNTKVLGLRIGDLAYLTDIKNYSEEIFEFIAGVSTLVISALRLTPSQMHITIDDAVNFSQRVGAKESYIIHLAHEVDHTTVQSILPSNVFLAYDGLQLPFRIES